MLEKRVTQT